MVDITGRPATKEETFLPVDVWMWSVGITDIYVKMPTPATVFYDDASGVVVLVIHPYELKGVKGTAKIIATNDPEKIKATTYGFFKSSGLNKNGHPDFDNSGLDMIIWNFNLNRKNPTREKIPYWLFEIALENLFWQNKFQSLLTQNGHIRFQDYTK